MARSGSERKTRDTPVSPRCVDFKAVDLPSRRTARGKFRNAYARGALFGLAGSVSSMKRCTRPLGHVAVVDTRSGHASDLVHGVVRKSCLDVGLQRTRRHCSARGQRHHAYARWRVKRFQVACAVPAVRFTKEGRKIQAQRKQQPREGSTFTLWLVSAPCAAVPRIVVTVAHTHARARASARRCPEAP